MFLPLMLRGDRTRALVIGGGAVAKRKIEDLLEAGAAVKVVATAWDPDVAELLRERVIEHETRSFREGDTHGFNLVIVATDDAEVNRAASEEARAAGIPVNVVDQPDLCTVYFAAVVRQDPLLLAISTGGAAPFLAREMKASAREWLETTWALRAVWAERIRIYARDRFPDPAQRDILFERFMAFPEAELARWAEETPPHELWDRWAGEETG